MMKVRGRRSFIAGAGMIGGALAMAAVFILGGGSAPNAAKAGRTPSVLPGMTLTSATSTCLTGTFCISGSVAGISPTAPQNLTLTLTNPNPFPIYVTQLRVAAGPAGDCNGGATLASPGWQASRSPLPSDAVPPTDAVPVGAASSNGPGQGSKAVTLTWTDSRTVDQTPCVNKQIPLTYTGQASWYGQCLTGKQNGLSVPSGTVACLGAGANVSNGIKVNSGGGLVIDPGAAVSGGINSAGGATQILFCGANLSGGVKISKATGPVIIGNGTYCPGNSIGGGLTVTNNNGGVTAIGNTVTGGSTMSGNSGPVPAP